MNWDKLRFIEGKEDDCFPINCTCDCPRCIAFRKSIRTAGLDPRKIRCTADCIEWARTNQARKQNERT